MIKVSLGPLPFFSEVAEEEAEAAAPAAASAPAQKAVRPAVLADGSYATQTALPGADLAVSVSTPTASMPNLRWVAGGGGEWLGG